MIRFRPFLNSDPPAMSEIWRNQAPARSLMQPMTPAALEELVFCKPYFDRQGLILAIDDQRPVGFVHAAFGPADDQTALDYNAGITCLLMVNPGGNRDEIAAGLLRESETYLAGHGARELYGGWIGRRAPFYQGLYGGGLSPGVLCSDTLQIELYQSAGYGEMGRCMVWQRQLASFRPVIDREIVQLRRKFTLGRRADGPPDTWWDACTLGQLDLVQFELQGRGEELPAASVSFWDIEPLASSWGVHAMGLVDLHVEAGQRQELLATFLLGEAMRELQSYGTTLTEVQTDVADDGLIAACQRLGFRLVDEGVQFRKSQSASN